MTKSISGRRRPSPLRKRRVGDWHEYFRNDSEVLVDMEIRYDNDVISFGRCSGTRQGGA